MFDSRSTEWLLKYKLFNTQLSSVLGRELSSLLWCSNFKKPKKTRNKQIILKLEN